MMSLESRGIADLNKLNKQRSKSLHLLQQLLRCADECLETGGQFTLHAPSDSSIWLRAELIHFMCRHRLHTAELKRSNEEELSLGTAKPTLKHWRYISSHPATAVNLGGEPRPPSMSRQQILRRVLPIVYFVACVEERVSSLVV